MRKRERSQQDRGDPAFQCAVHGRRGAVSLTQGDKHVGSGKARRLNTQALVAAWPVHALEATESEKFVGTGPDRYLCWQRIEAVSRAFRRVHNPETALIDIPCDVSLHANEQCDIERNLKPV